MIILGRSIVMYEATEFETEKLTACIHAALRWYGDDATLANSWEGNWSIVQTLIHDSFRKYERAVVERTLQLQPEQVEQVKRQLERDNRKVRW
jgi:hypothetical protein